MFGIMILESSPITHELNIYRRNRICNRFPDLVESDTNYLDLLRYVDNIPEKFFNQSVFDGFLKYLNELKRTDSEILEIILKEYEGSFSLAFRTLAEINALTIHDFKLKATSPSDRYALMQFCIEYINPNYLKIIEAAYANLILPMAAYRRFKNHLGMEKFDVFQRVDELKQMMEYTYISNCYNNTIRNGIAHGNVRLSDDELIYEDRKRKVCRSPRDIINLFDETMDICNGLALALRIFYINNSEFINDCEIIVPNQLILEKLQSEIDAPGWSIKACIPSDTSFNKRTQLIILVKYCVNDPLKIDYHLLRSAIFAERFYPGYERYFFGLDSNSISSWASFYGTELEKRRINEENLIENYNGVYETKVIFYKYNFLPRVIFKISTFISVARVVFPLKLYEVKAGRNELLISVRSTELHNIKYSTIINAIVVIESNSDKTIRDLIKGNCNKIAHAAIKEARRSSHILKISKYLIVGRLYIKIFVNDYRTRKLDNSGLIPDLLCTLEINKLDHIRRVDIAGGIPEIVGNYRIVWNKRADFKT
ncbi:hypothetical protein [Methanocrinis sp.]|uniref:hypothetical protein n=1 Tax=Methanocrinis sp. TaxID=3101522 RepID=UPI003D0E0774